MTSTHDTVYPLVSVLLPAYNHERFVEQFLDSVLADPYPSKEIIVIDDGSTDDTPGRINAWIARHGSEIPVEFTRRPNKGITATMNELAARAHGQYLRLGASDDFLLPEGTTAQVNYLASHPQKWAVVGDSIVIDERGHKLHDSGMCGLHGADKRLYRTDEGIRRAIISQWSFGGAVALIQRKGLESVAGWNESLRIEDWDFYLRLVARDAVGFIDMPVCAYRVHGNNFSRTRHVPARLLNLLEARDVAMRRACLFDGPYRTLLTAQKHLISAKIQFLQRRLGPLTLHMCAWMVLSLLSRTRLRSIERVAAHRRVMAHQG